MQPSHVPVRAWKSSPGTEHAAQAEVYACMHLSAGGWLAPAGPMQ
jgi:hypothetical protein